MNKYGVFLTVLLPLCGFAEAQEVVTVETPAARRQRVGNVFNHTGQFF